MPNIRSNGLSLLSFLFWAGLLAAPACSLPPPKGFGSPPDGGIGVVRARSSTPPRRTAAGRRRDGGPTTGTGVTVSNDITNVRDAGGLHRRRCEPQRHRQILARVH